MKNVRKAALAASAFACAALFSFGWAEQGGISLSVESAQARVGRPATPVSAAGVARRQARSGGYGYRAGAVAAGAAAIGTAAAVAATSPYSGSGPYYTGRGYYGGGPYASYAPVGWTGGVSSSDHTMYLRNLHDSGYNTKNDLNAAGNIANQ
jgi:hypothetical protein